MSRSTISRLAAFTLGCLIFSSCASQTQNRYSYNGTTAKTPSGMINNYKAESQKRSLDNVIVRGEIRKGQFLRNKKDSKVKMWIKYFTTRGRGSFQRYLERGEKYRPLIERVFERHNLPKELYFVGLIESGYHLKAKSHADAVGPWQFIKSTGKRYGLKIRHDVDERRSIVKSTEAAALFFGDLYNIFGSWELALSAYNAGEYGVIRRIRKARTRDFYKLSAMKKLPKETRNYVPKVRAAMEVYRNAEKYNISIPVYKNDSFKNFQKVVVRKPTYLKDISRQYGVSYKSIKKFNNDLKRNATPSTQYSLILPHWSKKTAYKPKTVKKVKSRTRNQSRKIASTYRVKKGDNLTWIARRNKTTISKIVSLNRLKKKTVYIGQKLKLPNSKNRSHYTVRPGDFLLKIAKNHNITIRELRNMNSMRGSKIYPGQKLVVSIQ
jgi:membrane-bound lytic murein transglycosylase D